MQHSCLNRSGRCTESSPGRGTGTETGTDKLSAQSLATLLNLFQENYFWQPRRVHPTDTSSLPPKPTGFWIAPTSRPTQLLAVLATHALFHATRCGLGPTQLQRKVDLSSEDMVAAILAPLRMGPTVGSLWGDCSVPMTNFEQFCGMCVSTLDHIVRPRFNGVLGVPCEQSMYAVQSWVEALLDSADDGQESAKAAFFLYLLNQQELPSSRHDGQETRWATTAASERAKVLATEGNWAAPARAALSASAEHCQRSLLLVIHEDVTNAADWDLDRLHECICGLRWLSLAMMGHCLGPPQTSSADAAPPAEPGVFVRLTAAPPSPIHMPGANGVTGEDADACQSTLSVVPLLAQVVLKGGKDGSSSAWIGSSFASLVAALLQRVRLDEPGGLRALTPHHQVFVERSLAVCSDLLVESAGRSPARYGSHHPLSWPAACPCITSSYHDEVVYGSQYPLMNV